MKERIVIDNNQHLPRASYYVAKDGHYDVGTVNYATPETILNENRIVAVKEQVPESWEELKELCKGIKGNKKDCGGAMWFEFPVLNNSKVWLGKALAVDQKGQVGIVEQTWKEDNFSITIFAQNKSPQQMWQIIKSLIGE